MSASTDTRLKGRTRWSMAARCPRMAAYGLLGEEPRPESEETQLRWKRGQLDETWFVEEILEPRYGADNVTRQKAIPWPADGLPVGELHVDAFTDGMPWEVKSHADGTPEPYDFVQLGGAIRFDPDADSKGVLVVIDRDLHRHYIPVLLTNDLAEQVDEIAAQVVQAARTGQLPERVCEQPSDGRERMCPFVDTCFAGWTPPAPFRLDGDHAELALALERAETAYKTAKTTTNQLDEQRKEVRSQLVEAGLDLQPGVTSVRTVSQEAGLEITRTQVRGRETFRLNECRQAGYWEQVEQLLDPFVHVGGPSERWTVKRIAPSQLPDPAAEEPPDGGDTFDPYDVPF